MEYTVIGDAVNLASRVEGAGKAYGTAILVTQATRHAAAADFIFRRVDRIRVVGKHEPVAIYELLVVGRFSGSRHSKHFRPRVDISAVSAILGTALGR